MKRIRKTIVKERYSNSNPITRRGIEVKLGATAFSKQQYKASHQSNITDKENFRPSNNSEIVSSQVISSSHSIGVTSRRRIRDSNSIYNDGRRVANQRAGVNCRYSRHTPSDTSHATWVDHPSGQSLQQNTNLQNNSTSNGVYSDRAQKTPSRFSRQNIPRRQYATSDISVAASTYHPPDHSSQRDLHFQDNVMRKGVYNDRMPKTPSQCLRQDISRRKYTASGISVAPSARLPTNHSFRQDSHLTRSNGIYNDVKRNTASRFSSQIVAPNSLNRTPLSIGKRFFQSDWQSPDRSLCHENIGGTRSTDVHRQQPSVGTDLLQKGIKRFQEHKEQLSVLALQEEEESKLGSSFQTKNDSWRVSNDKRQVGTIERKRRHVDSSRRDAFHESESNGQWFSMQMQPEKINPENVSSREFKKPKMSYSNTSGMNHFNKRRRSNTKLGQPIQTQHISSSEMRFEHTAIFDCVDSFSQMSGSQTGGEDQLDDSMSTINFFDNQKEVDMFGNPLHSSKSQSIYREQCNNRFGSQHLENHDNEFGQQTSSIVSWSGRRRIAQTIYTENREHDFRQGRQSMASQSSRRILLDQTPYTKKSDKIYRQERRTSIARKSINRSFHQTNSSGNLWQERQPIRRQYGRRSYHQTQDTENTNYKFEQGRQSTPRISGHRSYCQNQYMKRRDGNVRQPRFYQFEG